MSRSRLIVLVSVGVIWFSIVGVVIWRQAEQRRREDEYRQLLDNTAWVLVENTNEMMRFTSGQYSTSYSSGVGRSLTQTKAVPYTIQGDTIVLHGETVRNLKIQLLTQKELFLVDDKGHLSSYYKWVPDGR